jgi:AcrR family transcriptional regulator
MTVKQTELEKRNLARPSNQQAKLITKACFRSALIQLLDKKDINDISVSELTRKAGVSRTAFYSHYQTVDDVLSEIIDEELTELNNSVWEAINREEDCFPPLIQKIKDNYDMYSLLMKSNIENTAFFKLRDYVKRTYPSLDRKTYYMLVSAIGSLRNIILEWFTNSCDESVEVISSICDSSIRAAREEIIPHLIDR